MIYKIHKETCNPTNTFMVDVRVVNPLTRGTSVIQVRAGLDATAALTRINKLIGKPLYGDDTIVEEVLLYWWDSQGAKFKVEYTL